MTRDIYTIISGQLTIPSYRVMDTEIFSNINGIDVCMGIDRNVMGKTLTEISIHINRWYNVNDNIPVIIKNISEYWCDTYETTIIDHIHDIGNYDSVHMVSPGIFISSRFSDKEYIDITDRISVLSSIYNIDIEQTTKDRQYGGIIFKRSNNLPKILVSTPHVTTIDDIRTLYHELGHFEQDIFNQKEFDRSTPLGYILCEEDAERRGWEISDKLGDYIFDDEYRNTEIDRIHRYRDVIGIIGLISGFERADVIFPICWCIFDDNILDVDISLIEGLHGRYSRTLMKDILYNNPEKFMLIDRSAIDIHKSYTGLWNFDNFDKNYILCCMESRKNLFDIMCSIDYKIDTRYVQCLKYDVNHNSFIFIIRRKNDAVVFIETVQYIFTIIRDILPHSSAYVNIYYTNDIENIYQIDITILGNGSKNKYSVIFRSDNEYIDDIIRLYLNSFSFRYNVNMVDKNKIIDRFNSNIHLMYRLRNVKNIFKGIDKML